MHLLTPARQSQTNLRGIIAAERKLKIEILEIEDMMKANIFLLSFLANNMFLTIDFQFLLTMIILRIQETGDQRILTFLLVSRADD